MSNPNPALVAAAPAFDAALAALQTFITNLGPDPIKIPLTVGPALQVLEGSIGLQLPILANAEWSVVQSGTLSKLAALRQALPKPA